MIVVNRETADRIKQFYPDWKEGINYIVSEYLPIPLKDNPKGKMSKKYWEDKKRNETKTL